MRLTGADQAGTQQVPKRVGRNKRSAFRQFMPRRMRRLPRIRPPNHAQSRDLFGQKSASTIERFAVKNEASARHKYAIIRHACTLTERPRAALQMPRQPLALAGHFCARS
jgi:hypothetical protein